MNLAERAEQAQNPGGAPAQAQPTTQPTPPQPEPLPEVHVEAPGPDGPEQVPVVVAWSRVMADVRGIAKSETYDAPGTRYNFRGIDRTVNAFGPVLRRHGVLVVPTRVEASYRDFTNSRNKVQRECTVVVTWTIYGPAGDSITVQSAGEALDSSDKGTAKAQSVALRVLLLSAGMVPTGDPDPDAVHVDRGEAVVRAPASYVDEIAHPDTSPGRLRQIHHELKAARMLGAMVTNETGDEEPIGDMVVRIGRERTAGGGQ